MSMSGSPSPLPLPSYKKIYSVIFLLEGTPMRPIFRPPATSVWLDKNGELSIQDKNLVPKLFS